MIILYNDRDDRHAPAWSRHQKPSFPCVGAVLSTLLRIAESVGKLAFRQLHRCVKLLFTSFGRQRFMR